MRTDIEHKYEVIVFRLKIKIDFLTGVFRCGWFHAIMPQSSYIAEILCKLFELHFQRQVIVQPRNGVGRMDDKFREHVHELWA